MQNPFNVPTVLEQCMVEQMYMRQSQTRSMIYTYVSGDGGQGMVKASKLLRM